MFALLRLSSLGEDHGRTGKSRRQSPRPLPRFNYVQLFSTGAPEAAIMRFCVAAVQCLICALY